MKKLIIHETDCHGCGVIMYNGRIEHYCYDDGCFGDVKTTILALIDLGFINPDDVEIFCSDEIYKYVEEKIGEE